MTKVLVVSDSSSLILMAKAELLKIACQQFIVEIPTEVYQEAVTAGKELNKADAFIIEQAIKKEKIIVKEVKEKKTGNDLILLGLGKGEEAAIQLYLQEKAQLLLIDDLPGIQAAKMLEVAWVTAVSLTVKFVEKKKITREEGMDCLKILQKNGRYRLDFISEAANEIEKLKEVK